MAHFHVYSYTECSFRVNCVAKEFGLDVVVQHVCDEDVSDYYLFSIFEVAIFCQFFQNTLELFDCFAFFRLSWEKHRAIKGDISRTNESYLHQFPELEGSEIVDVIVRKILC